MLTYTAELKDTSDNLKNKMEIVLCDTNKDVVDAWHHFFDRSGKVTIKDGDIFDGEFSAIVLPINSFAIMNGGIAEQLNKKADGILETRARKLILDRYAGEMPVGIAEIIPSGLEKPPLVVLAPTTRVPVKFQEAPSINGYLAMRACLRAVAAFVRSGDRGVHLESVAIPGLDTGKGGSNPATAAFQMYEAYCQVVLGQVPNFATVEAATAHDLELKKGRFI